MWSPCHHSASLSRRGNVHWLSTVCLHFFTSREDPTHEPAYPMPSALAAGERCMCGNHSELCAGCAPAYASPMPLVSLSYARGTMHGLAFSPRICYTEIN